MNEYLFPNNFSSGYGQYNPTSTAGLYAQLDPQAIVGKTYLDTQMDNAFSDAMVPTGPYDQSVVSDAVVPNITDQGGGLWDSFSNTMSNPGFWQGAGQTMQGIGSIGSMIIGFNQLGLLEDQLAMQEDKWSEQKAELANLRKTREKLNTSYMA